MKQHLNRGYTKWCINDAINKASTITREDSLKEKIKQKSFKEFHSSSPTTQYTKHSQTTKETHTILKASEKCTEVFKYVPLVSYRRGRNLSDMLCSKRMPPQTNANKENPNRNDHNKKEDEPQLKPNQCPECGLAFRNEKGLKIHRTSKHRRKQNDTTFPGFWPCNSDTRCETCKKGLFHSTITSSKNGK